MGLYGMNKKICKVDGVSFVEREREDEYVLNLKIGFGKV